MTARGGIYGDHYGDGQALADAHASIRLGWYMSQRLREFYKKEFLTELRAGLKDGHYTVLPSEAAKIVADRWSVSPEVVLMSFLPST